MRDIQRAGKRFKKSWINADGPLERILILLVVVAVIGVTIGMLLPKVNPTVGEITGEYTATGTAAETLEKLTVDDNPSKAGYDRDAFGFRETDDDGNGCDVREDVLARDLTDVQYKNSRSCQVASGTLDDPYTGQTIQFVRGVKTSSAVQIDHVVALENAWQSGANTWDHTKLYQFGNDMYNLLAVDGPANQQKGFRFGRILAADEQRIPLRLRGSADWRERQVRADRHHAGKASDAFRAARLPRTGIAGKLKLIPV